MKIADQVRALIQESANKIQHEKAKRGQEWKERQAQIRQEALDAVPALFQSCVAAAKRAVEKDPGYPAVSVMIFNAKNVQIKECQLDAADAIVAMLINEGFSVKCRKYKDPLCYNSNEVHDEHHHPIYIDLRW